MKGWIKIHRKILEWQWWNKPEVVYLFLYLLLSANHEDGKWQGIDIKRGQFITGLLSLNKNTGLSVRTIRTCVDRLKTTGEITSKTTNKYRIITIIKYEQYQCDDKKTTSKTTSNLTSERQANDKQTTTNKNDKKNKNEKKNVLSSNDDDKQINSEVTNLINLWAEKWKQASGCDKPLIDWKIYKSIAKQRIKELGYEKMAMICEAYFVQDDQMYRKQGWEFKTMMSYSVINSLLTKI